MADHSMKANDRLPLFRVVLKRGGGVLDLTNASGVDFIMRLAVGNDLAVKINKPAVIADAVNGVVQYEWAVGDTDTPGAFAAEWEVTWNDGKTETFPTKAYNSVEITADLDSAA